MKETYHLLDVGICAIGITYGLENIESVLGVILLLINILQLVIKAVSKIYELYTKKASAKEVLHVLGSAEQETEELLDQIKIMEMDEDGRSN